MPDVLRPLFDQVVIKELEPERMRKSGLLVPQGTHDLPPNEGIVLSAGEGPPDLPDFKMPVKPGDHVVFPRSAGVWVEVEDERLDSVTADGSYLQATRDVLQKYGGLWFNDEAFVVTRK